MTDFFLHIPRSGGSSMRTLLAMNYEKKNIHALSGDFDDLTWFMKLPDKDRESIELVHGHFPFGLHAGFREFRYFSLIRNPVDRHFSEFFYAKKYPEHEAHERIKNGQLTLDWWAEIGEQHNFYFSNTLCQFLSGDFNLSKPTHATYQAACSNLEKMQVFGLTERFTESALMIAKYMGWKHPVYVKRNVIMGKSQLPESIRKRTEELQQWDMALFEFACKLFEKRMQQESRTIFPALEEFSGAVERASENVEAVTQRYLVEEGVDDSIREANELDPSSPIVEYLQSPLQKRDSEFQYLDKQPVLDVFQVLAASKHFINPQIFNRTKIRIWWLGIVDVSEFPRLFHGEFGWFQFEGRDFKGNYTFSFDDTRVGRVWTSVYLFPVMYDLETGQAKRFFRYKGTNVRLDVLKGSEWEIVADPFKGNQPAT